MAPAKKAKAAPPKTAAQGGLGKWFGNKPGEAGTVPNKTGPAPPSMPLPSRPPPISSALPVSSEPASTPTKLASSNAPKLAGAPAATSNVPAAQEQKELSPEQKHRIEENRRKALEKKAAKRPLEESESAAAPASKIMASGSSTKSIESPVRPGNAKGLSPGVAAITPEKSPSPTAAAAAKAPPPMSKASAPSSTLASQSSRPSVSKFDRLGCTDWMQYNSVYRKRLTQLRPAVEKEARSLWSASVAPQSFLNDISAYRQVPGEVVLIGVLFKEMKSRPNVIEMYRTSKSLGALPSETDETLAKNLCTDKDVLWLEDHAMRLQLEAPSDLIARLVTGLVVAVRGTANAEGNFKMESICFARKPQCKPLPSIPMGENGSGRFLALISGLQFGLPNLDEGSIAARERAIEFLVGRSEDSLGQHVSRLIVCGGLIGCGTGSDPSAMKAALVEADEALARLAAGLPTVHVMPGRSDPTSISLPQMPLHPHLFRRVREHRETFKSVGNPYSCELEGLGIMGHSGQPCQDILRCTQNMSALDTLELCFETLHLAPTAPDTLPAQPFVDADPFVIDEVPHIFFSGGHDEAAYRWHDAMHGGGGTLCVCIPAFHKKPALILINTCDPKDVRIQEFS